MHSFDVDMKTAEILLRFYGGIPSLIENIQTNEFSPESLLGEDFHCAHNLTDYDKQVLFELCMNGMVTDKEESDTLEDFGTIYFEDSYYWVNQLSRLNYELHSGEMCKPVLMSKKTKKRMIQKQEEERIQAEKEAKAAREDEEKRRHEAEEKAEKFRKRAQQV